MSTWIQTYSGKKFFPLEPNPADLEIEDIAHSLANQCRFAGHVREFYSVAQHSVLVSKHVEPYNAMNGLLHDASEAYLLDMPRPIKRHESFASYRAAESVLTAAIETRFGVTFNDAVHRADMRVFAAECRDLMSPLHPEFDVGEFPPIDEQIKPLAPSEAKELFLYRFHQVRAFLRFNEIHNELFTKPFEKECREDAIRRYFQTLRM